MEDNKLFQMPTDQELKLWYLKTDLGKVLEFELWENN